MTCSCSRGIQEGHCCAMECWSESLLLDGGVVKLKSLECTLFSQKNSLSGSKRLWKRLQCITVTELSILTVLLCASIMLHSLHSNQINCIVLAAFGRRCLYKPKIHLCTCGCLPVCLTNLRLKSIISKAKQKNIGTRFHPFIFLLNTNMLMYI